MRNKLFKLYLVFSIRTGMLAVLCRPTPFPSGTTNQYVRGHVNSELLYHFRATNIGLSNSHERSEPAQQISNTTREDSGASKREDSGGVLKAFQKGNLYMCTQHMLTLQKSLVHHFEPFKNSSFDCQVYNINSFMGCPKRTSGKLVISDLQQVCLFFFFLLSFLGQ